MGTSQACSSRMQLGLTDMVGKDIVLRATERSKEPIKVGGAQGQRGRRHPLPAHEIRRGQHTPQGGPGPAGHKDWAASTLVP